MLSAIIDFHFVLILFFPFLMLSSYGGKSKLCISVMEIFYFEVKVSSFDCKLLCLFLTGSLEGDNLPWCGI